MIRYLRVCRYQQLSSPYQPRPYLMAGFVRASTMAQSLKSSYLLSI